MPKKILGVTVSANETDLVLLTKNDDDSYTLEAEATMRLQAGARPAAYAIIAGQFTDYCRDHAIECTCIKASAVSLLGTKLVHLQAAELRGVVQAAAAVGRAEVRLFSKAAASRSTGKRKVDAYLKDDSYWADLNLVGLKKGMREAAFVAISATTN